MSLRRVSLRSQASKFLLRGYERLRRMPMTARVVLGLFLVAALLMGIHTAIMGNASLHLKVQHGFRNADLSLWIDGELAYAGKLKGSAKRRLGLIPGSIQGSLSQVVPVTSGNHVIRVRVESDEGSPQEDTLSADFARDTERDLSVWARPSGLTLSWGSTNVAATSFGSAWFSRYASTLFLTIAGSMISALTGFALRELPGHLRARENGAKAQSTAAGR